MKIILPKTFIYQFLFVLCIAATYFDNYEFTFFTWTISFLFTLKNKYSTEIFRLTIPFVLIIIIAFLSCIGRNHNLYFIIRDITYLIKPVLGFLIGYQILKSGIKKPFELISNAALIVAIYHLILIAYAIVLEGSRTVQDLRHYSGFFSDFEVYAFVILLFHKEFGIAFTKKKLRIYLWIVGISAFMYLARTNFIQFVVLWLAIKGYFTLNKRSIAIFLTLIVVGSIGYSAIVYYNPKREGEGVEAFLYKIKVAPLEPFKTKIDRTDWKDFNDNYRSYENIRTVREVSAAGTNAVLFGKGLGSTIDLNQDVNLGGTELRHISILHNGFMIVFLKSGLLGILIYLFTIFYFFRKRKSTHQQVEYINLLFIGTGVFLFISNWVFLGFFNLTETKSILIGLLIAYRQTIIKNIYEKHPHHTSIS